MKKRILLQRGIILILLVSSCGRGIREPAEITQIPIYYTWLSLNEMEYYEPIHPLAPDPPQDFFPWAGIASHHILAHDYLDAWFSRLAEMRDVECFFILSPEHYGVSLEPYSLTVGSWESGFGPVESDIDTGNKLAHLLEVELDTRAFRFEHGVSALMPYIKKYFPRARVVAIACEESVPVNIPLSRRLADVLENEFDETWKRKNFFLISADFSHHHNLEETARRDSFSRQYFENMADVSWFTVSCDNRVGMYILGRLGKNNLIPFILYHTNSWEIANQEDDITGYFFVYFADKTGIR